jgi:hypothetical protein
MNKLSAELTAPLPFALLFALAIAWWMSLSSFGHGTVVTCDSVGVGAARASSSMVCAGGGVACGACGVACAGNSVACAGGGVACGACGVVCVGGGVACAGASADGDGSERILTVLLLVLLVLVPVLLVVLLLVLVPVLVLALAAVVLLLVVYVSYSPLVCGPVAAPAQFALCWCS